MRFAWVLFVLAGSSAGVGWVDHPVAVVAVAVLVGIGCIGRWEISIRYTHVRE